MSVHMQTCMGVHIDTREHTAKDARARMLIMTEATACTQQIASARLKTPRCFHNRDGDVREDGRPYI